MHTATQDNQRSDRGTSEGAKVDGDVPVCMRRTDSSDDHKKNEGLKGRGGGQLKHYNVDGDMPPVSEKN